MPCSDNCVMMLQVLQTVKVMIDNACFCTASIVTCNDSMNNLCHFQTTGTFKYSTIQYINKHFKTISDQPMFLPASISSLSFSSRLRGTRCCSQALPQLLPQCVCIQLDQSIGQIVVKGFSSLWPSISRIKNECLCVRAVLDQL